MYNITLEFVDHNEQICGLTRKQAARIVEAHPEAEDIWVSVNPLIFCFRTLTN